MILFNVDLDNTLIYSYKHDIGERKRCAEIYQGREISFITDRTQELLREISRKILIVPTTTRTIEQYERVDLGLGKLSYALVCNGGVLLADGAEDEKWYAESLSMVAGSSRELKRGQELLEADADRCFEVRDIRGLFLFTKSNRPEQSVAMLSERLDTSLVDVFHNGCKVYVVPKSLNKGRAAMRLKEKLQADKVIAAGDSEFDISMLRCADIGIAPEGLAVGREPEGFADAALPAMSAGLPAAASEKGSGRLVRISSGELFSEGLLAYVQGYV